MAIKTKPNHSSFKMEDAETAVIYEANIRQYSAEGTFEAFTKDIPKLKELGVKIIWLMPIHPIGLKNRKGELGSYYSIQNYHEINSEFGDLDDFKHLLRTAHKNDIYIILDWVANHTAWDHHWTVEHPEYYEKEEDGNFKIPHGWDDTIKLDYNNREMREAMFREMKHWVDLGIDGFRCDMAMLMPTEFWNENNAKLREICPLFFLMEGEQPDLMESAFDMAYSWTSFHLINDIAKGYKNVWDWHRLWEETVANYPIESFFMRFTSNHDENSWNDTEFVRLGDAVDTFAALTYLAPGMPLIYSGQEYDFNRMLKFFDKDEITPHEKGKMWPVYEKLGKLKNTNPALNGGKNAAKYQRIATNNESNILAFKREKDGKKIYYIANLSHHWQTFGLDLDGEFYEYLRDEKIQIKHWENIHFSPWYYWILVV